MANKRIISCLLALASAASMFPAATAAEAGSASLKGLYEPYNTISVVSDLPGEKNITWKISDTQGGEYTELKSGAEDTLFVSKNYAEKWIKAEVAADGLTAETEPRQVAELYVKQDSIPSASADYYPNGINRQTPESTLFNVDGQEFILLDVTESDESKFFVMSKTDVGKSTYFDTSIAQDLMCFLNNKNTLNYYKDSDTMLVYETARDFSIDETTGETEGYKGNPNYVQLPDIIFENIDNNHIWQAEPKMYDGETLVQNAAYAFVGGISVPSAYELLKYYEKFGFCDFEDNWWTRSPQATQTGGDGSRILITYGSYDDGRFGHAGKIMTNYKQDSNALRPVFYLDRSFFLDYPVSFEEVGSDVAKAIFDTYSVDELLEAGYDPDEIGAYDGELKNLEIKGVNDTNMPLKAFFEGPEKVTIQWYASDSENGEYLPVSGANSNIYIPDQAMGQKWIKFSVSAVQGTLYSEPVQLNDRWYSKGKSGGGDRQNPVDGGAVYEVKFSSMPAQTDDRYIFTAGGQNFILLDVMNDDESRFLVMSQKTVGERNLNNSSQVLTDLMCWFNDMDSTTMRLKNSESVLESETKYSQGGGYFAQSAAGEFTALPNEIVKHINRNAVWKAEPKQWVDGDYERTYTGGITIPSATELERYSGKYGWHDTGSDSWWLRTGQGWTDGTGGEAMLFFKGANNAVEAINGNQNSFGIRPIFYLDSDFFTEEKLLWEDIGAEVRRDICKSYSKEELLTAGYTEEEIGIYYDDTDYEVSNINISGSFETTTPLYLSYDYDGSAAAVTIEWQSADAEGGEYTKISGSQGLEKYILPTGLGGKYIRARITLLNGNEYFSQSYYVEPEWKWQYSITDDFIKQSQEGTLIDAEGNPVTVKAPDPKRTKTPAKYTFSVDGQQFVLLDTVQNNGDSKYLVMSVNSVGSMKYPTKGQLFDEMAAFLNNKGSVVTYYNGSETTVDAQTDYSKEGGYIGNPDFIQLPREILDNIDYSHVWKIERKMYDDSHERAVTAGIVLPSVHEILEYSDRIGLYDERVGWWTRTPSGRRGESGDAMLGTSSDFGNVGRFFSQIRFGETGVSLAIRPMFYLKDDFFRKVRVEDIGETALSEIKAENSREELGAIYSESELASIFGYGSVTAEFRNLDNGKTAKAIVTVAPDAIGMDLIFAVYDSGARLIGTDMKKADSETVSMSIEGLPVKANNAKLMTWDNINNSMKPTAAEVIPYKGRTSVFLAGDSTVADYADANKSSDPLKSQYGWGEVLGNYFEDDVLVVNCAVGSRSAKSFINEGRLDDILSMAVRGDYIFVQFGHNDQWSQDPEVASGIDEYKEYLLQYVQKAEELGVNVVFVTPPVRRMYSDGNFTGDASLGEYPQAMRDAAAAANCSLIDLFNASDEFMSALSENETANYYMPNDPQHFNINGANELAKMVTNALINADHPLGAFVKR